MENKNSIKYEASICMTIFGFIVIGLDLGVTPLILLNCWNNVIPQTFDNIHEIDYIKAFYMRLIIYAFSAIFGRLYNAVHYKLVIEHYANVLIATLDKNKYISP